MISARLKDDDKFFHLENWLGACLTLFSLYPLLVTDFTDIQKQLTPRDFSPLLVFSLLRYSLLVTLLLVLVTPVFALPERR